MMSFNDKINEPYCNQMRKWLTLRKKKLIKLTIIKKKIVYFLKLSKTNDDKRLCKSSHAKHFHYQMIKDDGQ